MRVANYLGNRVRARDSAWTTVGGEFNLTRSTKPRKGFAPSIAFPG